MFRNEGRKPKFMRSRTVKLGMRGSRGSESTNHQGEVFIAELVAEIFTRRFPLCKPLCHESTLIFCGIVDFATL